MTERVEVAVVGAGVLGLAHAWAAARQGRTVAVFERSPKASGASIRNFGMIWPIGRAPGVEHQVAMRSRALWVDLLEAARLPYRPTGSLHAVYRDDEADVAREFADKAPAFGYSVSWISAAAAAGRSSAIVREGLQGALWSPVELTVDPRAVIATIPLFLAERYGVHFCFDSAVRAIDLPRIETSRKTWHADFAIVCGGDDFVTLYPEQFRQSGITRCKLQMMRTVSQPDGWNLGPSLASALSFRVYQSFEMCGSLAVLKRRIASEAPDLDRWDIHILVSQTSDNAITIGDSHEYGDTVDIFDKTEIDEFILAHARRFLRLPDFTISQRWHGVYARHPEKPWFTVQPAPNVRVVTAAGGAGMTLSMGLGERIVDDMGI